MRENPKGSTCLHGQPRDDNPYVKRKPTCDLPIMHSSIPTTPLFIWAQEKWMDDTEITRWLFCSGEKYTEILF